MADGSKFHTTGPVPLPEQVEEELRGSIPTFEFHTPRSSIWASILPLLIPVALIFLIFWWFQRAGPGADERDHVDWPIQGQDLHHRAARNHL